MRPSIGVRRVGGHAGQLERLRVDPARVAVAALEVDRAIRHDAIEVVAVGDAAGEIGHRPAVAADPRLVRVRGGIGGDRSRGTCRARARPTGRSASGRRRHETGWTCASPKPGVTDRPRSSTTRVRGPIQSRTASSPPTATIRPSRTATRGGERPCRVHRRDAAAAQDEVGWGVVGHRPEDGTPACHEPAHPGRRDTASGVAASPRSIAR